MNNRETKSKVMALGNRLSKTMDRREAFIQAWVIVKAGAVTFPVRGVMAENRQEALKRLNAYAPAQIRTFLLPELENKFDNQAIAIMVGVNGGKGYYKLGYIPASETGKVIALRGKASIRVLPGDIHGARLTLAV